MPVFRRRSFCIDSSSMRSKLQSFQQLSTDANKKHASVVSFRVGGLSFATITIQEFTMSYLCFRSFGRGRVSADLLAELKLPEPDRVNTDVE